MRVSWEPDKETWDEFKKRRSSKSGISGMGQKKREGTGKINKSELREKALKRANFSCEWPECDATKWLEMAHITGIGMGGMNRDISNNEGNVAIFCKYHHDIFDGKTISGQKREYTKFVRAYLERYA